MKDALAKEIAIARREEESAEVRHEKRRKKHREGERLLLGLRLLRSR